MIQDGREIIPRILRDMSDGVLVLDRQGQILYLNEQGRKMLGESQDVAGRSYAAAFLEQDTAGENDAFHQFVLDAVYDKEHTHSGEADYRAPNRQTRRFSLTSSFLRSEDGAAPIGVVVLFSDVTEIARLNRQRRESSTIFAVLMICVWPPAFSRRERLFGTGASGPPPTSFIR